jgi:HTH-type transcriptional regulator/antitoxin HigA
MSAIAEITDEKEYAALLSQALPHVIHTEEENDRCTAALEAILEKRNRTAEEHLLAELLTLLIEDFEAKNYALPPASPVEVVRHLMESNGLRQMDIVDCFGTPSVVSEVLNGKRELAKAHIEKLSARFHVSPEVFFSR